MKPSPKLMRHLLTMMLILSLGTISCATTATSHFDETEALAIKKGEPAPADGVFLYPKGVKKTRQWRDERNALREAGFKRRTPLEELLIDLGLFGVGFGTGVIVK